MSCPLERPANAATWAWQPLQLTGARMAKIDEILHDYSIMEEIGRGARSLVYKVERKSDGARLAAKFVAVSEPSDLGIIRHLENEHSVLGKLHRHPVPVTSLIVRPVEFRKARRLFRTKAACHIMEFAPGRTLAEYREHPLALALRVFIKVCDAMDYVHSVGYIHADLKPNNIMVDGDAQVKLIDFGFALPVGTKLRGLKGTWGYLAPEQTGGRLNAKTDVFNLGAVMYWTFTGRNLPSIMPDEGEGIGGFVPRKFTYPPPSVLAPELPQGLSDLVLRCLSHKTRRRPTMIEVRADLNNLIQRLPLI